MNSFENTWKIIPGPFLEDLVLINEILDQLARYINFANIITSCFAIHNLYTIAYILCYNTQFWLRYAHTAQICWRNQNQIDLENSIVIILINMRARARAKYESALIWRHFFNLKTISSNGGVSWLINSIHWMHSITMLIGQPSLEGRAGKGEKWFWSQKWLRGVLQVRGGRGILTTHKFYAQVARGTSETNYYYYYYYQGRSQRGAGRGGRPPPDKVLAPLVGPGRYIQSVQNNKFFNKNTLVHLKDSLASGGKAPGSNIYVTTLE